MLCTCVAAQSCESLSAESGVGQHAVYSDGHCLLGVLLHQHDVAYFLQVAGHAGEPSVDLLLEHLAGIAVGAVVSDCCFVLASE